MRIGVTFPQIEFGNDPVAIRDYAQTVEGLGYTHFLAYDHVLGADASVRPGWTGSYASDNPFHEVFVLLGYLAGLTTSLELVTGVLILPQRQTALVAKQAAEVDVLSGGRLRLGVGVGWNEVEYQGLDKDFSNRGARSEEQIALLRALWTSPVITFDGQWERIDAAGINPLPVQRPIPIWIGGYAEATLRRVGQLGDGWFPWREPNETMRAAVERIQQLRQRSRPRSQHYWAGAAAQRRAGNSRRVACLRRRLARPGRHPPLSEHHGQRLRHSRGAHRRVDARGGGTWRRSGANLAGQVQRSHRSVFRGHPGRLIRGGTGAARDCCFRRLVRQKTSTLLASAQRRARSGGVVKEAFLPSRSACETPRACAQPPQTKIGTPFS